jgi:hypothetical protein
MSEFDPIKEPIDDFGQQIYLHRHGFYALYKHYVREPTDYDFFRFLDSTALRMKQSYSKIGYMIHGYLIYWSWSRIFCFHGVCPEWTLVYTTGWIQAIYYTLTFQPNVLLQQWAYYYGSLIMNGALFLSLTLSKSNNQWILQGEMHGTFASLWKPIVFYILFLMTCSRVRLASWILGCYRERESQSVGHRFFKLSWKLMFFLFPLVGYFAYRMGPHKQYQDITVYPNSFLLLLDLLISFASYAWINFLTFQIEFIVWEKYWERGLVLMKFGSDVTIGVLY